MYMHTIILCTKTSTYHTAKTQKFKFLETGLVCSLLTAIYMHANHTYISYNEDDVLSCLHTTGKCNTLHGQIDQRDKQGYK